MKPDTKGMLTAAEVAERNQSQKQSQYDEIPVKNVGSSPQRLSTFGRVAAKYIPTSVSPCEVGGEGAVQWIARAAGGGNQKK